MLDFKTNNFDLMRLVFASIVVYSHLGTLSQAPELFFLRNYTNAAFAVQCFFVVSGFLVTMSYEKTNELLKYASKRIRRIAPAYVVVVVGAAVLLSLVSTYSLGEYFTSKGFWRYLGYNLILSNFTAPELPGVYSGNYLTHINGSLWTIKIEVAFYCIVPLVVYFVRKYDYKRVLFAVLLGSIAWHLGFLILSDMTGKELYAKLAKQLPGQMSFFAGGAWAYYKSKEGWRPNWIWGTISCALYFLSSGHVQTVIGPVVVTIFVFWLALGTVYLGHWGKYGDFSYGIYLYHFPLIQLFVSIGVVSMWPYTSVIILSVLVLCIAVFSWYFIERPFMRHRAVSR